MSEVTKVVVFVAFGVALGSVVEWVLHRVSLPIPYTVVVFYIGILFAVICKVLSIPTGKYIDDSEVSSSIILYGLLPTLLFSETMHINLLHFRQSFVQSSILAGPGGVIVACLLAMSSYLCLPFNWSWNYYFLFGSIMCATDPVSVVSLLKTAKASSSLSTIIAGESLLNDGSAMILYFFFYNMINGTVYTVASFVTFLVEMLVLSPLIGIGIGFLCFYLTRRTSRPTNLHIDFQILFCFAAAYSSYYIAGAVLGISGVLACCAAGVTVALLVNPSIVEHAKMHEVWEVAEWVCNTLIFLLGGFVGGGHTYRNLSVVNVLLLLVMYVFLTLSRAVMLTVLFPLISRIGMRMTVPDAVFVTAAGLRGALAIALALDAARNADDRNESEVGGQFFFIITGLVSMTLLLNGSTAGKLLLWLGLVEDPNAPMSLQKTVVLLRIKRYMQQLVQGELAGLQSELGDYDEAEVTRLCGMQHSEYGDFAWRATVEDFAASFSEQGMGADKGRQRSDSCTDSNQQGEGNELDISALHTTIDQELVVFARTVLLDVVRARYMDSIHSGKIGSSVMAAKILLYSVDVAMDHVAQTQRDWECVEASLTPSRWLVTAVRCLDDTFFSLLRVQTGFLGYLDAFNERNALYVLINYIDAHEHALDKLQYILGIDATELGGDDASCLRTTRPERESQNTATHSTSGASRHTNTTTNTTTVFSKLEAHQVIIETVALIEKARQLLTLINPAHLRKVYTHRAARIILIKQEEILHRMLTEGTLSESLAHTLFDSLASESDRINVERASTDRRLIRETRQRKMEEELEMRESIHAVSAHGTTAAASTVLSFSHAQGTADSNSSQLRSVLAPEHGQTQTLPTALKSASGGQQSPARAQLFRVDSHDVERGSLTSHALPVASRTSLRSQLTGDDSVRASFTAGRIRPIAAAPTTTTTTTAGSLSVPSQHSSTEGSSSGADTHNPLNQ